MNHILAGRPQDPIHDPFRYGFRYATHGEVCGGLMEGQAGPIPGCSGRDAIVSIPAGAVELQTLLGSTDPDPRIPETLGIFAMDSTQTEYWQAQMAPDSVVAAAIVVKAGVRFAR